MGDYCTLHVFVKPSHNDAIYGKEWYIAKEKEGNNLYHYKWLY